MCSLNAASWADHKTLRLLQPGPQARHRLGAQGVDAHAGVEVRVRLFDQAGATQHRQVTAHSRRGQPDRLRELAGAMRALSQQVDCAAAVRVGQRRERPVEVGGGPRRPTG